MNPAIDTTRTNFSLTTSIVSNTWDGDRGNGWTVGISTLGGEWTLSSDFAFNGGEWSQTIELTTVSRQTSVCRVVITAQHEDVQIFGAYAGQLDDITGLAAIITSVVMQAHAEARVILAEVERRLAA